MAVTNDGNPLAPLGALQTDPFGGMYMLGNATATGDVSGGQLTLGFTMELGFIWLPLWMNWFAGDTGAIESKARFDAGRIERVQMWDLAANGKGAGETWYLGAFIHDARVDNAWKWETPNVDAVGYELSVAAVRYPRNVPLNALQVFFAGPRR